ncbi:MAG: phosphatidate cytidylyltransferase [Eubacteriales bacterium]|nr:phosphatidate cytidylyltransferase [Eubacteriales bacterium]
MKTRVLSGIVLAIIMISSLLTGGWYLYGLTLGISLIGMFELYRVLKIHNTVMAYIGYAAAVAYYICMRLTGGKYDMLLLMIAMMAVMTVYVFTFPKHTSQEAVMVVFGLIYVAVALSYIYKVRTITDGIYIVWLIFVASWGNDTFAYFTGVLFGKHKMAPVLSPKKSVEGAVGGIAGATILGLIYGYIVGPEIEGMFLSPAITFAAASCIGALLAIVGDLCASAIKRNYEIKDYGKLIPGHGGIMDRFDSVIFTAPAVYWAVFLINRM